MRIAALIPLFLVLFTGCRDSFNPESDADEDGYEIGEDCDDDDPFINPGADELCDGVDNDCDGEIDDAVRVTYYADSDGDGYGGTQFTQDACEQPDGYVDNGDDCDDLEAASYPGGTEVCDAVDNNCDGIIDEGFNTAWFPDSDGDGFGNPDVPIHDCDGGTGLVDNNDDCNDANADAFPGGTETCDGQDEDCDGSPDNGLDITVFVDLDGDGYGENGTEYVDCQLGETGSAVNGDCDDTNADINPGATEVCDREDNNCDGNIDEVGLGTWYQDSDGDLFGDSAVSQEACDQPIGFVATSTDCDDENGDTFPGASEVCDGLDNNCDGNADEGVGNIFYVDDDSDGWGDDDDVDVGCVLPPGFATQGGDCDDDEPAANPGLPEVCDLIDNNCNGAIDEDGLSTWFLDSDADGFGANASASAACEAPSASHTIVGDDCDDTDANNFPGNAEACDGKDNDCDTTVDEEVTITVFADVDGDGYGDPDQSAERCSDGGGFVLDDTDCDDSDSSSSPEGDEICDGADNNCDGGVDEGVTVSLYTDSDDDDHGSGFTRDGCSPGSSESAVDDDCDDTDDTVYPGAVDVPGDGIDQDCIGGDALLPLGEVCYGDTSVLTLGKMIEGSIDTSDQTGGPRGTNFHFDDHEIALEAGTTYTVSMWSETADTFIYVLDDSCAVVDLSDDGAVSDFNSALSFTAGSDTVYTVIAATFDDADLGTYRLRVSEGDAAASCLDEDRVIGLGEEVVFSLGSTSPTNGPVSGAAYRAYGLWLEAGEELSLQATGSGMPAYLAILDDSCAVIADDDGVSYTDNARLGFSAPDSGIYTIVAGTDTAGSTGSMTLHTAKGRIGYNCFGDSARATVPRLYDAVELSGGDSSTGGPLGSGYTWDDYEVVAGPRNGIYAHGVSPELELHIEAYDEDCSPMASDLEDIHTYSDSRGLHASPEDWAQIVTFGVSADSPGVTGRHVLSLAAAAPWDTCGVDSRGITVGESVHEHLTSTDPETSPHTSEAWDDYELYLQEGERIVLTAGSDDDDIALAVLDDFCTVLASNNDSGVGNSALIDFTAPTSGMYTIAVSNELVWIWDVEYWLQVSPAPLESSCWSDDLAMPVGGGTYDGTLDGTTDEIGQRTYWGDHYQDDVNIWLAAGQEVQIDMTSAIDTYLYLLDDDCTSVASDDDGGSGTDSRITYTAPTSGVYTIVGTTYLDEVTGNYSITTTSLTDF